MDAPLLVGVLVMSVGRLGVTDLERLYIIDCQVGQRELKHRIFFVEYLFNVYFWTINQTYKNVVVLLNFLIFRLKESGAINGSLFALGQVVDALNQGLVRSNM